MIFRPTPGPKPAIDETESGSSKKCEFKVYFGCCVFSGGPAVVQAVFRWFPVAQRWFKLFSGGCRWPNGSPSCFPVVAGGPTVVQAVFRWLPVAQWWSKVCPVALLGCMLTPRGASRFGYNCLLLGVPLLAFRGTTACFRYTTACFSAYFVCLDLFLLNFEPK